MRSVRGQNMKLIVTALAVLLIGTNAFWLYRSIDSGVTMAYRDQNIYELDETSIQLAATLTEIGKSIPKEEFLSIASRHTKFEPFEKGGCIWVGWIGLKFNEGDELIYISPEPATQEDDLCGTAL